MKMDYRNVLRRAEYLFRETQSKIMMYYLPSNNNGCSSQVSDESSVQEDFDFIIYLLDKPIRD